MSEVDTAQLQLRADMRWGKPCLAFNVQLPIVGEAAGSLCDVQAALGELLPGLRPIPATALHVSLYGVIPVSWESDAKEQTFGRVSALVLAILEQRLREAPSFCLTFDALRVDPLAVITLARQWPPIVDELRQELGEVVSAAGIPGPSYSIVHCTLARFSQAATLGPQQRRRVESWPLRASVRFDNVRLVRERVYPSLDVDVLAEYPLR